MSNITFFLFSWSLCLSIFFQMIFNFEVRSNITVLAIIFILPKTIKKLKKEVTYIKILMLIPFIVFIINQIIFYQLEDDIRKSIVMLLAYFFLFIFLDLREIDFKKYINNSIKMANILLIIYIYMKFYIGNLPYFNHMIVGNFLSFISVIYFLNFLIYKRIEKFWIINIGLILVYAHRGALIPLFLMIFYITYEKIKTKKSLKKTFFLVCFLISIGIIFVLLKKEAIYYLKEDLGINSRLINKSYYAYEGIQEWGDVFSGRKEIYNEAINLILDKPFGGGIYHYYNNKKFFYSHLVFLDLILNFGLSLILIIFLGLLKIKKILKVDSNFKLIVIYSLLNLSSFVFSYYYIFLPYFWIFYSLFGYKIHSSKDKNIKVIL